MSWEKRGATVILAIENWDNDFAIRLPKSFCKTLDISVGDSARVFMENDQRIVIEPVRDSRTLKERMHSWTSERYRSDELDWGETAREELW